MDSGGTGSTHQVGGKEVKNVFSIIFIFKYKKCDQDNDNTRCV